MRTSHNSAGSSFRLCGLAGAVAGVLISAAPGTVNEASAHSMDEVEKQLREREQYVEIVERPAPSFTLQDPDGRQVSLSDYRGKVVVLWFIYASCPDVCPLQSRVIADIQEQISRTPMRDLVQFVAITTDPARDKPEVLKQYGPAQGLEPGNWVFLTSSPERPAETTRALAEQYGLKFVPTKDGMQMHGTVTHLIDREGAMRARYHGLTFNQTNFIVHLNALTNEDRHDERADASFWEKVRAMLPW